MKQIVSAYIVVSLTLFALLAVLSYGYGAGYVYVNWRGWQLQSTLFVSFMLLAVLSLLLQLAWYGLKRRFRRQQRQTEQPLTLDTLHPYEQLGVMWLLKTAEQQQGFVQQVFDASALLQHVVQAKLALMQQDHERAQQHLAQVPNAASDLVALIQIELLLEQQQSEAALAQLSALQQCPLAAWLQPLAPAFEHYLTELWVRLALQQPWLYLQSQGYGYLPEGPREQWLQQLLQQFEQAQYSDLQALQERFYDLEHELPTRPYATQVLWLKLLARLPEMSQAHEQLALQLLQQQFDQDVFYLWFQQKLLAQNPDYLHIQNTLLHLEQRYPSLPILNFAGWHIDQALGRYEQALARLECYPDNVLMGYLRIKNLFKDDDQLIQQLNLIFNNDAKFIQFKI